MRKKRRKFKFDENKAYTVLFALIIFAIFQYAIERIYVFFLYPDEFGYWSSAATILGWDWQEVASLGSYYSFGYSIWLLPILKFITGAPGTYRGAILINLLLMYLSFFQVTKIAERIIPRAEKKTHIHQQSFPHFSILPATSFLTTGIFANYCEPNLFVNL